MDEPGVAAECPPEQKEKEQEGARSEGVAGGGAGDRDLPTTDGVTTGATSAVAITIKNNPDTQTLDTAGGREAAWLQVTAPSCCRRRLPARPGAGRPAPGPAPAPASPEGDGAASHRQPPARISPGSQR